MSINAEQFAQLPPELQQLLLNANTQHPHPHPNGHAAQHTSTQFGATRPSAVEYSDRQKYFMMVLAYAVRAFDYGTVALKYTWLPFCVYIGSSSRFNNQSIDWLAMFRQPKQ